MFRITTFGSFSIESDNCIFPPKQLKSKKMILLLEYLIANRGKIISQDDLFENLWGESDSSNPTSALKTLIHRTRSALSDCGIKDSDKLITVTNGSYMISPDIKMDVDFEEFERLHHIIMHNQTDVNDLLNAGKDALNIYKGQFLSNSANEFWVIPLSTYYNTLYIDIVKKLIGVYRNADRFSDIVELCKDAVIICPFEEDFYFEFTNAVFETGNNKSALEQYDKTKEFFSSTFGVNLSEKFESLHTRILAACNNTETNINVIEKSLEETEALRGAFFCEYEFFKRRFQLEVRASKRNNTSLHICLFSLLDKSSETPPTNKLTSVMSSLVDTIRNSLRASDTFARFSASQYIVMLTGTSDINTSMVASRVKTNCEEITKKYGLIVNCDIKSYNIEILNA